MQYVLTPFASSIEQSKLFASILHKLQIDIKSNFLVSPTVCFLVELNGGPETSISKISVASDNLKINKSVFRGCISHKKMLFASFIDLTSFSIHSYLISGKEFLKARRTGERHSTMYDLSDISRLITLGDRNLNIAIKSSRMCLMKKRNLAFSVISLSSTSVSAIIFEVITE